jgi:uncharacterized heparinase superfamily protein
MGAGAWTRAARLAHTLRNTPPGQLLRRAELRVRLRLAPRVAGVEGAAPPLATVMPNSPFAPRPDRIVRTAGGWLLLVPWGGVTIPEPLAWRPRGAAAQDAGELNNLHYMDYAESLDDAALAAFVISWIDANPLAAPGAVRFAWRPYNLSLRVAAWARELARRGERLPPTVRERMAASLAAQLRFLAGHLETDLRGNHLIKNLRGLLWGGAVFAGSGADRWRDLGSRLLARELDEQVLADGCHHERSPAYQCQVLEDLIECRAALPEGELRRRLDDALARMVRASLLLAHPDGLVAGFNDGGLTMARPPAELASAFERLAGLTVTAPDGPFALPEAGYWGLKAPGERLVIDCGPFSPAYLPGHAHCDILSLEWSTGGRRILVDQGTYQYAAGPRRRTSRSTLHHNTVSVAEAEQSDIYGAFRCGRRARAQLLGWHPEGGSVRLSGTHDGFDRLPGRPRHSREVEAAPGRLVMRDRVEGGAGQEAVSRLLLHPDCTVDLDGQRGVLRCGSVAVTIEADAPLKAEEAEWYPDLYVARPTVRLVLTLRAGGPAAMIRLSRVPLMEGERH